MPAPPPPSLRFDLVVEDDHHADLLRSLLGEVSSLKGMALAPSSGFTSLQESWPEIPAEKKRFYLRSLIQIIRELRSKREHPEAVKASSSTFAEDLEWVLLSSEALEVFRLSDKKAQKRALKLLGELRDSRASRELLKELSEELTEDLRKGGEKLANALSKKERETFRELRLLLSRITGKTLDEFQRENEVTITLLREKLDREGLLSNEELIRKAFR